LFEEGTVLSQDYEAEGIRITVRLQANDIARWEKFINNNK
jgi:GTP-binding protein HflX